MPRSLRVALPLTCLLLAAGLGFAEEGAAAAEAATGNAAGGTSIMQAVIDSGWVEYVLIALSIVAVSISVQRMMTIKPDILVPDGLVDDMHNLFAEGVNDQALEEAVAMVQDDDSMLGQIVFAALDKRDFGYDAMKEAAENTAANEHNKYMSQVNWLSLIASMGPMLGLLGTVTGMITAFFQMASSGGNVDPAMLSSSIGGAMITTATGLIIAIPTLSFFFFLRARVNRCVLEASVMTSEVLDYFRNR